MVYGWLMAVYNHNTTQQSTASATANHVYPQHLHCLFTALTLAVLLVPGIAAFTEVAAFNNVGHQ